MSIETVALQRLLALHAVLEERSVARAAKRLNVSPSAVSNSLAKLRDTLADPLVVRSGRGIVPTSRAEQIAPALANAFASLEEALRPPSFDSRSVARTFVLAVADSGQISRVPSLVARMRVAMPKARLTVVSFDAAESLGGLSGRVDVAIGPAEGGPGIYMEDLGVEGAVLTARAGHPASRRAISRDGFARLEHVAVAVAAAAGRPDLTARAYEAARVPRAVAVTVPTFAAAAMIASASDLVATLPESTYRSLKSRFRLTRLRGPIPAVEVPLRMAWHVRSHQHPELIAFRALVSAVWTTSLR